LQLHRSHTRVCTHQPTTARCVGCAADQLVPAAAPALPSVCCASMRSPGGGQQLRGPVAAQARTDLRWHPMLGQPAQALSAPWRWGRAADAKVRKRGPAEGALTIGNRANGHACPHLHGFHPLDVVRWAWTPARDGVKSLRTSCCSQGCGGPVGIELGPNSAVWTY
jgi:hypothetical protein